MRIQSIMPTSTSNQMEQTAVNTTEISTRTFEEIESQKEQQQTSEIDVSFIQMSCSEKAY